MIDTDQYEGHTPTEEWDDIVYADNYLSIFLNDATIMATDLDRRLMAAAPLLLAEVERLRRELDTQYEYIEWLEEFAPKAGEYNTAWDAYELAKGIHWTQMEEEE